MNKTCKGCGITDKHDALWWSNEYCSRSCALQKWSELKGKIRELFRLLSEKR